MHIEKISHSYLTEVFHICASILEQNPFLCLTILLILHRKDHCDHTKTSITVSTAHEDIPPLPTSVQPISITKTLLTVPTKNERNPPLFTGKLLIKFQNILRNTTGTQLSYDIG
jgi:hypothetical protein